MAKMNPIEKAFVNSRFQYYLHRWFGLGKFLKKIPPTDYRDILEIGGGVGTTAELLAEKYPIARILSTDFDEDSIETANRKGHSANITFQQADATKLVFPDNHFDAAFSILTFHHIGEFEKALVELVRTVKKGGDVFIMDIPSASFNFTHFRKSVVPGLFTKQDLIRLGEKHGLRITDYGGKYLFSLHGKKQNH